MSLKNYSKYLISIWDSPGWAIDVVITFNWTEGNSSKSDTLNSSIATSGTDHYNRTFNWIATHPGNYSIFYLLFIDSNLGSTKSYIWDNVGSVTHIVETSETSDFTTSSGVSLLILILALLPLTRKQTRKNI